MLNHFGFKESTKGLSRSGSKDDGDAPGDDEPLTGEEAKAYRGIAARINFASQDHPVLQFASRAAAREMANPVKGSMRRIKRLARFLVGCKRVVWH